MALVVGAGIFLMGIIIGVALVGAIREMEK